MSYLSIAIPTYEMNGYGNSFLDHSLSILSKQSFSDFEVVISDHSINDDILDVVNIWKKILNIKYIKNHEKRGWSSPNLNNAIINCTGDFIKILLQDDFLLDENSLLILSEHIKSNIDKHWFVTACEHSNDGKTLYRPFYPKWTDDIYLGNNRISSPSVITIKNDEQKLYFDDELIWLMDVDYYKRMYDKYGEPSYLQKINVVNRTWSNSVTNTISQSIKDGEVKLMKEKYDSNRNI